MDNIYKGLTLVGIFGGLGWCLFSIAFRWRTLTHTYGRHAFYAWFIYIVTIGWLCALGAIIALVVFQHFVLHTV
jgi:hypothetical protein